MRRIPIRDSMVLRAVYVDGPYFTFWRKRPYWIIRVAPSDNIYLKPFQWRDYEPPPGWRPDLIKVSA